MPLTIQKAWAWARGRRRVRDERRKGRSVVVGRCIFFFFLRSSFLVVFETKRGGVWFVE